MKIYELIWPDDRVEHIALHGVTPEEVEEICFGNPLVQKAKSRGENPVYYVLGQTDAGKYLFCVIIRFSDGRGYPVTARPMTDREKQRFKRGRQFMGSKIPAIDSVQELACFWDSHDITDYEEELEEIREPVFERRAAMKISLRTDEMEVVKKMALQKGLSCAELVRNWIMERIQTV